MIRFLDLLSLLIDWGYAFVFFWIMRTFLPLRRSWPLRVLALLCSGFVAWFVIYPHDLVNLLGTLAALAVYLAVFHRGRWVEKLAAVLVFYPALIAVNYLMLNLGSRLFFSLTGAVSDEYLEWSRETVLVSTAIHTAFLLARLLFWLGAWLFLRRYLGRITETLTTRMWLVVGALMLAPFIAVFTMIYFMPEEASIIYPSCIASIFSSFGCIYLTSYLCDSLKTTYLARQLEMQKNYYMDQLREEEQVRRIYHDMKNHLLILQSQNGPTQEIARSVEALRQQIAGYENYYHTGNEFLDVLLRDKARAAREKQIDFSASIQLQGSAFIEPLDLSTLFGNALDNALEASEALPQDQRLITVKASRVRDMLVITVENNVSPDTRFSGSTTKKDSFLHGFGLSNIQKAAEKYGGQCTARLQGGKFLLQIILPVSA